MYDRQAFSGAQDTGLRGTFDTNLRDMALGSILGNEGMIHAPRFFSSR